MEETQNQTEVNEAIEVPQVNPPQSTNLSVDSQSKKGKSKWLLIFIGLLILGGAGIFFFTRPTGNEEVIPTPFYEDTTIEDNVVDLPTASPEAVVKTDISIEIQNGTGIPGEAAYLQEKLKVLGYSDIEAGNASSTDNTDTTVTFLKATPQTVQDEIKKELEKIYKTVIVKTATTQKVNVLVVTGLRSGQTAKPVATSTSKATATPVASSSASPSASPTTQ